MSGDCKNSQGDDRHHCQNKNKDGTGIYSIGHIVALRNKPYRSPDMAIAIYYNELTKVDRVDS